MKTKIFTITENGFSVDGSGCVAIPACRVKAFSYTDAIGKLNKFLDTKVLSSDIELITPLEKIAFD